MHIDAGPTTPTPLGSETAISITSKQVGRSKDPTSYNMNKIGPIKKTRMGINNALPPRTKQAKTRKRHPHELQKQDIQFIEPTPRNRIIAGHTKSGTPRHSIRKPCKPYKKEKSGHRSKNNDTCSPTQGTRHLKMTKRPN